MRLLWILGLVVLWLVLANTIYVVNEAEQVILTQFGKPVGDPVTNPGLHARTPFVQKVHRFDRRFMEWDGDANELPTKDKRFIWVDAYARWRITDPLLYFQRLRDERGAHSRLDDILDGETRNAIANHNLEEVVRSSNRTPLRAELDLDEEANPFNPIEIGRERIREIILEKARARTTDLGIEILDFRLKRINYVNEVRQKVYERMIAERRRIADRFRSEGEGEALRIRGEKERELNRIRSEAYRSAQTIIGQADARATRIFAQAYDQSPASRSFYAFVRTLESYASTIDSNTSLVLTTDGQFYRYLEQTGN